MARKLTSEDLLERLSDLFICRGVPDYVRGDNGPEFTAHRVRDWLETVEVKTLFIEPGSPWENGYVESFNGKLRDELLTPVCGDGLVLSMRHKLIFCLPAHIFVLCRSSLPMTLSKMLQHDLG